jgi:WD40 repeat protein
MSRVVRSSKFRHVFGTPVKKENTWDGVKPSRSAWDSNKVAASNKYVAVIWDASGGGAFAVLSDNKKGKLGQIPLVTGHSAEVLDLEFNPFHEAIVASCSEDGYTKIWQIPEGGLTSNLSDPVQTLSGHKRKVGTLNFNPVASNVIATTSTDYTVKVWDVETGQARNTVEGHADIIQSSAWNYNGSLLATASKDKKVRLVDPRANKIIGDVEAHQGVKGMRVTFLGQRDKLFSMGFSKTSERQLSIWDPKNLTEPVRTENIDTMSGILMPFYDNDTSVLYLAGKGDGNIRYYEVVDEAPYIHFLSEFKSASPQRGMGWVPKTALDLSSCEIARLLKLTANAVEPVSFTVPRKSDMFQDDLYPPTYAGEPTLNADQWFGGSNAQPKTITLSPGYAPPKPKDATYQAVKEEPKKERSVKELTDENDRLQKRVAYLEAELAKLKATS